MVTDMDKVIGLKVDVDTFWGMRQGVPALLSLFKKYDIHGSFFVPMGKDHTGWTVKRVFTKKGFLKKANRVGVLETYGFTTLMYGLLLPGPEIVKKNAQLLKKIKEDGHEVGIHGYDHVYWHDHIRHCDKEKTEEEIEKALSVYKETLGERPLSFAAPGWMINNHALRYFQEKGFIYTSDTRGTSPFFPKIGGEKFDVIQIPSTLPTLDEVVGIAGTDIFSLTEYFLNSLTEGLNILTVHTELEGKRWLGFLEAFIETTLRRDFQYKKLLDIAIECRETMVIPTCEIVDGYVEGRAGEVSCQQW